MDLLTTYLLTYVSRYPVLNAEAITCMESDVFFLFINDKAF